MKRFISYVRVSTKNQGESGLSIQAQRDSINNYIGDQGVLLEELVEVESGGKADRVQLKKAVALCVQHNAILIVSKLDRLARNLSVITNLRDANIQFVAVDNPNMSNLIVNIMSSIAEEERLWISSRIKSALQVLKDRGVKLGNPNNFTDEARAKGREAHIFNSKYNPNTIRAKAYVRSMVAQGLSLNQMVEKLNSAGFVTAKGKSFHKTSVVRLRDEVLKE